MLGEKSFIECYLKCEDIKIGGCKMDSFFNSLSTTQQVELIKQVVPTASIGISAIISFIIFFMTKTKEIKFKVHEQRKIKYEHYLSLFQRTLASPEAIKNGILPVEKEEWMKMQIGIIIYGSDRVIKKIVELNDLSRNPEEKDNQLLIVKLGELMHIMRKEVGLTNKNVSIRDSLSLFIIDIKEDKYNYLFK